MTSLGTHAPARFMRQDAIGTAAIRRGLDVLLASTALLLLAPLLALLAMLISSESGWPVLFSQTRIGEGGRHFRLYKFRKFSVRAPVGNAVTLKDDCRLTRVGKFLAETKLDELPQLWNVLTGDMTLVGPRPESLAFADCFGERYGAVLVFRPGIFGPNQAFLRNECMLYPSRDPEAFYRSVLFPLKARADLAYFPHRTLSGDIGWVVRGLLAVLGCSDRSRDSGELRERMEAWIRRTQDRNAAGRATPRG